MADSHTGPLAFVAWIDNQWGSMTPEGGLEVGKSAYRIAWPEIYYINITAGGR